MARTPSISPFQRAFSSISSVRRGPEGTGIKTMGCNRKRGVDDDEHSRPRPTSADVLHRESFLSPISLEETTESHEECALMCANVQFLTTFYRVIGPGGNTIMSVLSRVAKPFKSRTTVLDNMQPSTRRMVDQAIVDRNPPTYKGIYEAYHLDDFNISYHAFYRYARRLRLQTESLHLADLTLPKDTEPHEVLPRILLLQMLEALNDPDEGSTDAIRDLAEAYYATSRAFLEFQKQYLVQEALKEREPHRDVSRIFQLKVSI